MHEEKKRHIDNREERVRYRVRQNDIFESPFHCGLASSPCCSPLFKLFADMIDNIVVIL
jgi:hypothetical protein